jgi:hypothetical protein
MARQFKLEVLEAFTGGLNLRSDQFNLAENESPDLLNVVVDPRGGIRQRDGVDRLNTTALSADIEGIWGFFTDSGTAQVMVNYGTKVAYATTSNFTDLTGITARTAGTRVYGMTMNNVAYGVSGDKVSFKWDGSSAADLGLTLNGSAGNFPQAQYVTFWNNFAWAANTVESATNHKYRVRWSNANEPEKWAAADYVDIDKGEHGDYITGLLPMGDRLLVFKSNSIHAIYGWDSDSFQVVNVTNDVGSIPLSSPVSTTFGTFFWYGNNGVYVYDGQQFMWLFAKLQPAIDDGRIRNLDSNPPQLAWGNNKLYVSVDWTEGGTTTRRTLIYDPTLGEGGAWVTTDIDAAPLYAFNPPNATATVYAGCVANTGILVDVEDAQNRTSDRYSGSTEVHIESYFVTRWVAGRDPIVKKRWGRPRVVLSAESTISLPIQIYKDYDKSEQSNSFTLSVTGKVSQSRWGTAKWDNADPDSPYLAEWDAIASNLTANVQNLPTLGTGRSISMKVSGPSTNNHWEVNALAFTYTPRRLR